MSHRVEVLDSAVVYDGFFRMVRYRLRHGLFEGGLSEPLTRELFERGHSVGVLPYDADRDEVLLTEQFRVGALEHPRGAWLMEIIAGMVEPGEMPVDVARREAVEEADCRLDEVVPICEYLVSPGGTSESVALYCARMDSEGLDGGIHGHDHEGEDIKVHVVPFEEAMDMVETGVIHAAMPIIALQWLALNRERIRERWQDND